MSEVAVKKESKLDELQKALESKAKSPHWIWFDEPKEQLWVSLDDAQSLLTQVFSQEKVMLDRKQLSELIEKAQENKPHSTVGSLSEYAIYEGFIDGLLEKLKELLEASK